jgi:hypothetical protein
MDASREIMHAAATTSLGAITSAKARRDHARRRNNITRSARTADAACATATG